MPLTAKRVFTPSGLPSTEVEINSDSLAEFGIKRGSTIDYLPFDSRYINFLYLFRIEGIEGEFIADKKLIVFGVEIGNRNYSFSDLDIVAVIIEKPKLRLVK
jgi:hypothetical protein